MTVIAPIAVVGARHGKTDGQHEEPIHKMLIWGIGCERKARSPWLTSGLSIALSLSQQFRQCRQPHRIEKAREVLCNSNIALLLSFESLLLRGANSHDACVRCGCRAHNQPITALTGARVVAFRWGLSDARAFLGSSCLRNQGALIIESLPHSFIDS